MEIIKNCLSRIKMVVLFCVKWRFLIAIVVFVLCLCFQIHGSSIGEYNKMFDNSSKYDSESIIIGKNRGIRGDEYLVNTPYQMSQQYNDYKKDSYMMSVGGQDMVVSTNAPVIDLAILSKPFNLGYILLGNDYGLSWYWSLKIITLVLASFEFCLILTRRNKKIALLGALMISLAPPMQWWFSSSVIDIIVYGMVLFSIGYYYFVTTKRITKNIITVCAPFVMTAYAIALYPAVQVPIGLLMVALLVGVLIRDKKDIVFTKIDFIRIGLMVLLTIGMLGYVVINSLDAIVKLNSTVYPGKRVSLGGGGGITGLFTNLVTFTLSYKSLPYSNNCEASAFIHFAPVFLILYPFIFKKSKKSRDLIVGNIVLVCLIVAAVFMLVGFPELLAKLTLFSYVSRPGLIYGFVATVFTIWCIYIIFSQKTTIFTKKQILLTMAIYGFFCICMIGKDELTYFGWKGYAVIIVGLLSIIYMMLLNYKKCFLFSFSLLMIVSGAFVNPIARGTAALTGHPLEKEIHRIAQEYPDVYWLGINGEGFLDGAASSSGLSASIGIANGAKMLNMVNFYPDFKKWHLLDPQGDKDAVYNRYAHIIVYLGEDTKIEVGSAGDIVRTELTCDNLDTLGVGYLITFGKINRCEEYFSEIYDDIESDYYIYQRNNE